MKFYSTNRKAPEVSLRDAVLNGLPPDNGLYMPESINALPDSFFKAYQQRGFAENSFEIARTLLQDSIDHSLLEKITFDAINFPAPVKHLGDNIHCLELFHGPSLAFKDFGGRFMARLMSHFVEQDDTALHILVATSGDTGGAVAMGFHKVPGIKVTILYPKNKVSHLQELQLTTLGENITALEVDGVFDDCQALVKQAFLDEPLRQTLLSHNLQISSANSINISRLIPQIFYYFEAIKQVASLGKPVVMSVPSGNFGNLTAGLIAKKMGLPIHKFIASVNDNDGFFRYLKDGVFEAKPSIETLSTAMDVGNPSNLVRINDLYQNNVNGIKEDIASFTYSNDVTADALKEIHSRYDYVADPHGAVGYLGLQAYLENNPDMLGIFQETAHPAKFLDVVEPVIGNAIPVPDKLAELQSREKLALPMSTDYADFKRYLAGLV